MMAAPHPIEVAVALARHRRGRANATAAVRAFQDRAVRRLVAHSYARVRYYRTLLERHGIRPETVGSVDDLAQLPVTDKSALRDAPVCDVVAQGYHPGRLIAQRTSGSTGQRLTLYRTWLEQNLVHLFRLRALHSVGARPRDLIAAVGLQHEPHPRDSKLLGRVLRAGGLFRRARVDLFESLDAQTARLRAIGPDVLSGYPGALARLAHHLLDTGDTDLRPRLVVTGAEVLTTEMRRTIEAAFGAPAFDLYGSHEFNLLGWQCPEGVGMHVVDDSVVVEILAGGRPVEPGETGEVVVTALHLYAMPLIRYRLGDLATRGPTPCSCGAPWSTLYALQGRTIDYFMLPDGRTLHPYRILTEAFAASPLPVRQWQLVQEQRDTVTLRVVLPAGASHAVLQAGEHAARALLGPAVRFRIDVVDEIRPDANGKLRILRSDVPAQAAGTR